MPGLFGTCGKRSREYFDIMEKILAYDDYHRDEYHAEGFSVGRLSLGTFFPQKMPVFNEDKKNGNTDRWLPHPQ